MATLGVKPQRLPVLSRSLRSGLLLPIIIKVWFYHPGSFYYILKVIATTFYLLIYNKLSALAVSSIRKLMNFLFYTRTSTIATKMLLTEWKVSAVYIALPEKA